MEIDELFGLPAHPLVVHAAVVMLPLAALLTLIVAIWPRARKWWGPVALFVALTATFAGALAQQSGESLEESVDRTELVRDHTSKGETVLPWAIAVTAMAAVATAIGPLSRRYPQAKLTSRAGHAALVVVASLVTVGATYVVIDVGHSGAKATWSDVGEEEER
jgi:uncharacterized membrane protein